MSRKKFTGVVYNYEHYGKEPVDIKPYNGGYGRRLFKDHFHKTPVKITIPENVSDMIYGKTK